MAIIGPTDNTLGWGTTDAVAVLTPSYTDNLTTNYTTFSWFNTVDAKHLTDALKERIEASGKPWATYGLIDPTVGSQDVGLALTWSALQLYFLFADFASVIDTSYNDSSASVGGSYTGYLSWGDIQAQKSYTDAELFEQFCLTVGLNDGAGNYGFRYALDNKIDGTANVVYPNSTRECTAGDYLIPELLDDMLVAMEGIAFVSFEAPTTAGRYAGNQFNWQGEIAKFGNAQNSVPTYFFGDWVQVYIDTLNTFSDSPDAPETVPYGTAFSQTTLEIDSSTSECLVVCDSYLQSSDIAFTTGINGSWTIHVKTETNLIADEYDDLGSNLLLDGWNDNITSGGATKAIQVTSTIGNSIMNTDWFDKVPPDSFVFAVGVEPELVEAASTPTDWNVAGLAFVDGEDVTFNNSITPVQFAGDISSNDWFAAGIGLTADSSTTFTATIFNGTSLSQSDSADAELTVPDATTTTTTVSTSTTTTFSDSSPTPTTTGI